MSETGRTPDPAIAAAAAQLISEAQTEAGPGPGRAQEAMAAAFTQDPTQPDPLLPQEQAAPAAVEPAAEPEGLPQFESDTTGIEHLLDAAPEPEEEDEPEYEEPDPEDEYTDDETKKLRAKVKALEKKTRWLEEQKVKAGQKNWFEEAKRRFPLAPPEAYSEGTSRNAVLKAAASAHDQVYKIVEPHLGALKAGAEQVGQQAAAAARVTAEHAWGKPSVGPPEQAIEHAELLEQMEKLHPSKFKNLADLTTARMKAGFRL